jgi:hypothetical protein
VLLSGEAESIGDREGKFWAKDANDKPLVSEARILEPSRTRSPALGRFSLTAKRPNRPDVSIQQEKV